VVTAPLQFFSRRGFAGAGDAFDQIVSDAHFRILCLRRLEMSRLAPERNVRAGRFGGRTATGAEPLRSAEPDRRPRRGQGGFVFVFRVRRQARGT
jgi:hypothetical protein